MAADRPIRPSGEQEQAQGGGGKAGGRATGGVMGCDQAKWRQSGGSRCSALFSIAPYHPRSLSYVPRRERTSPIKPVQRWGSSGGFGGSAMSKVGGGCKHAAHREGLRGKSIANFPRLGQFPRDAIGRRGAKRSARPDSGGGDRRDGSRLFSTPAGTQRWATPKTGRLHAALWRQRQTTMTGERESAHRYALKVSGRQGGVIVQTCPWCPA